MFWIFEENEKWMQKKRKASFESQNFLKYHYLIHLLFSFRNTIYILMVLVKL